MQRGAADGTVTARLPETYQWLLAPVQASPQAPVTWQALRLAGQDAIAVRASKKLKSDELLITSFAATRLRMEIDRVPLWRGDDVAVKQLAEDFARYVYLPRLRDPNVLLGAVRDGVARLTWDQDAFAFADSFDEAEGRCRGLRAGQQIALMTLDGGGLLVKPAVASAQVGAEAPSGEARPSGPGRRPHRRGGDGAPGGPRWRERGGDPRDRRPDSGGGRPRTSSEP